MHCPYCLAKDTRVAETRLTEDNKMRRRRACDSCNKRFTTFETYIEDLPIIIKNNNMREEFDENKIKNGLIRALQKRPVDASSISKIISKIKQNLQEEKAKEISSRHIGELVMLELRAIDKVAYVRFASVYRDFKDIEEFKEQIDKLLV